MYIYTLHNIIRKSIEEMRISKYQPPPAAIKDCFSISYIFWTVQPFFIFFCIKIEYHKTFKMMMSLFWKNAYLPPKRAKIGKNRVFGLLRKIESLDFARNGLKWSVFWLANFLHKSHIWENSHSRDVCEKALDQSDRSIFQITISFEPFNRFLYFFA